MKSRGRPVKIKNVRRYPPITQFSPRGKPGRPDEIELKLEEFEALKLTDYIGLSQKKTAAMMGVSQQTVSRILKKARKSLSKGLVMGAIIRINGGSYRISGHIHNSLAGKVKGPQL